MRPPEFTGGNIPSSRRSSPAAPGFNEAAGIHRRKLSTRSRFSSPPSTCFNEAAGIHRRKLKLGVHAVGDAVSASMRPPEFTGGNHQRRRCPRWPPASARFNEAAGIHRRKPASEEAA